MSTQLGVVGIGRMAYAEALDLQRAVASARISNKLRHDVLLLVEHPPVITLGRSFHKEHLVASHEELAKRGIDVFEIERGGDVTYHGPGQLVGYPIYCLTEHLPDLHKFLRQIEDAIINAIDDFGLAGRRRDELTGVWINTRKIASIGIHVKKWVTWHGFSLNVTTNLADFDFIVPCGIEGVEMTSMQRELEERTPRDLWGKTADSVVRAFCEVFDQSPQAMTYEDLMGRI